MDTQANATESGEQSPTTAPTKEIMGGYADDLASARYRLAPEREIELDDRIFGGTPWALVFNDSLDPKRNTFEALMKSKVIDVNYAALASVWAVAKASLIIAREGMSAARSGQTELATTPDSPVFEARQLVDVARSLIRSSATAWPDDMPLPVPKAVAPEDDWYVNNVFLGAAGWIVLHEIGHIHLDHQTTVSPDVRFQQEHQADEWAAKWILDNLPADHPQVPFRVFVICVAIYWLAILDDIRRGSSTHPHAWQRLNKISNDFPREELNPGYEMATYVLKVLFLPSLVTPVMECPEEALFGLLVEANDLPR